MGLRRDRSGPLGHLRGGQLRGSHHQQFGRGEHLADGDGDVTGAGRQVEQQHVQVAPVHVGQELLQRPVQHRPAPDHGSIALGEHADRDDLHVVRRRRHDHVLDRGRAAGDAQHPRHRMAVDVGVHHADLVARGGQRRGQVDRDRRLAHPALAAGHRVDPGQRGRLGERDLRLGPPAAQLGLQVPPLLIAHHVQVHADRGHAGQLADRRGDVAGDGVPQRAPRDGQPHLRRAPPRPARRRCS